MTSRPGPTKTGRRRVRILAEEERRLWDKVAETVEPLDARAAHRLAATVEPDEPSVPAPPPAIAAVAPPPEPTPPRERVTLRPTGPTRRPPSGRLPVIHVKHSDGHGLPPAVVAPPSLERFDHRTRRRLVNGAVAIDDRLDLHGMTQDAAHSALRHFLFGARARGARIVLVITGKGKTRGPGADPHDRGVLRRAVPHWLA